jgi:hypothetical protein
VPPNSSCELHSDGGGYNLADGVVYCFPHPRLGREHVDLQSSGTAGNPPQTSSRLKRGGTQAESLRICNGRFFWRSRRPSANLGFG